jgi:hypothetical protein
MAWAKDKDHIRHIRDLEEMLRQSAMREFRSSDMPDGFREYWDDYFRKLYRVPNGG